MISYFSTFINLTFLTENNYLTSLQKNKKIVKKKILRDSNPRPPFPVLCPTELSLFFFTILITVFYFLSALYNSFGVISKMVLSAHPMSIKIEAANFEHISSCGFCKCLNKSRPVNFANKIPAISKLS